MKISTQRALLTFMVWLCCVYILGLHNAQAQQVTKLEYFFNQDPGFGKGTTVPVTPGEDVTKTFPVDVTPLSPGFHQFYLRSKNTSGQWSMTSMRTFYKEDFATVVSEGQLSNVTKGEFFFDTDPGFGKGTNIRLSPGQDLSNVTLAADITSLSPGFHQFYLRFKNANGQWSMTTMRTFYKESLAVVVGEDQLPNVTKGEFFFDTDPGFGKGTNMALTPGQDLNNVTLAADITALTPGFHQLYLRFKNTNGQWSMTTMRTFYKESLVTTGEASNVKITKGEYYIDTDPGFGKGINIPFTPSTDLISLTFTLNMDQISVGNHKLYVRFQDENGNWSATSANDFEVELPSELIVTVGDIAGPLCANSTVAVPFTVNSSFGSNNIFTAELSDANGSFTNAVAIGTLAGTGSGTMDALIPANTPAGTNYRIRVTASSPAKTSEANSTALTINRLPENFSISGAGATCLGFQTYTTNLAAQDKATYTWEVTGGGSINPNGNTATVNWTSAGTYTVKVVASNSCGNSVERVMTVTVNDAAPALAPLVTTSGRWMYASTAPSDAGVVSYQWYVNGGAISGANSSSYYAYDNGDYTVKYKNFCGEGPVSNLITFSGSKQNQTIAFDAIPDKTYGDEPFALNATASSGLPVTYTITAGSATVSGSTLTITGGGVITVQAAQAGDNSYNATSASQSFTVNKANAALALASVTQVYDGAAKVPTATTTPAGLPVSFTYNGSSTAPVNAGTYDVVATISSSNYQGATTGEFIIEKAAQTIVLESVPDKAFGNTPFTITAAAVSGLPVSLSIETVPEGIATLSGATVTILGAGTVTVTATQGGSSNYAAAPAVSDSFTINKASQRISFAEIPDKTFGDEPFDLSATSSSGLPVQFSILSGPATVEGSTIKLTGTGTVTVRAAQAGNAYYLAAANTDRSFNVNTAAKKSQTITFAAPADKTFGDGPVALSATASSGLPVSFSVVDGPTILNGSTLTITGAGTITVRASQAGDDTYNAAAVEGSFSVSKADQRISFLAIEGKTYGDSSFEVTATSTSGLPVSFGILSGPATISGNSVTITGAGTVELVASQDGNTNYNAASSVSQSIPVGKASQSITFAAIPGKVLGDAPFTVSAEASSDLPVSFSIRSGPATISGNTITLKGLGVVEVTATQAGNYNFLGASVSQRFSVLENIAPALSITKLPADATEGGLVTFTVSTNLTTSKPLDVFLSTSSQSRFPVPPSVTIPAGSLSADVTVSLEQDDIPEIDIEVNIMAGAADHQAASAFLVVKDDDVPGLELIVHTNTVSESGGAFATQATLRRAGQRSSTAFTANLSADLASALILPATVSLAAGENEKTFTIGVVDNSEAEGDREVTITASVYVNSCSCSAPPASSGSVAATLTVTDNDGPALSLSASQLTLLEGFANAGQLRISRNTPSDVALSVNLSSSDEKEATVPATVTIPAGQAFVEVPITTVSDGVTDGSKQVYFHATAKGYSTGAVWVMVSDQNSPDLQIASVSISRATVQAGSLFNYRLSVNNAGFATAPTGLVVRGYLSKDSVLDASDLLISEDVLMTPVPAGQTVQVQNAVKAPNTPGAFKLLYWVNPELKMTELLSTNNKSTPVAFNIQPGYTATAVVSSEFFLKGKPVPVTGTATNSDGTAAANKAVELYIITNGLRRTVTATTDAAGQYSTEFVPLANEAGHYVIGASFPGISATEEQDNFDILGVRINNGEIPQFKTILGDAMKGTLAVRNMSSRSLNNFTLEPVTLPAGAQVQFDKVAVLAGNATVDLSYTITGSALSPGVNFETATLNVVAQEGIIQSQDIYYFCQVPNAFLQADVNKLDVSASSSKGERQVELRLLNKGMGATGNITVSLPQVNWLSSVTSKTLPSLSTGDSTIVILKFLASAEVPFDYPIKGNITVSAQNGNALNIPFTFEKVSETTGNLVVSVTNQFTYFSEDAPKVKNARVTVKNYFSGEVYAEGYTNSEGEFNATGIPEGRHRITVEKEKHLPYNSTVTINPGATTETSVFINYQAITFSWSVVPTAIEDEYDITLVTEFETHVPVPVVTIDMPKVMPQLSGSEVYAFNIVLTNHGLIKAESVTLNLPNSDPEYEFVTNYVPGELLAQQAIQVPVVMRRRDNPLALNQGVGTSSIEAVSRFLGMDPAQYRTLSSGGQSCTDYVTVISYYTCNVSTGLWQSNASGFGYDGRTCTVDGDGGDGPFTDSGPGGGNPGKCAVCGPGGGGGDGGGSGGLEFELENKSCVECIQKLISVLTSCSTPNSIKCGVAVVRSIWVCANTSTGGAKVASSRYQVPEAVQLMAAARKTGGDSPELGAIFQQIAENLQIGIDMLQAKEDMQREYFGDMIDSDAFVDLNLLLEPYTITLDSIRPTAQVSILNAMQGYEIQQITIQAFIRRWNTSVHARSMGIMEANEQYPDIINWNLVQSFQNQITEANAKAIDRGFKSAAELYEKTYADLNEILDTQQQAVCASVKVQFSQKLTMTREAFEGTLDIFNGHPTDAMDSLSVHIEIKDAFGVPSNGLFEIQTKTLTNLSDVTGTGNIAAQQNGTARFLFIPELGAAPTEPKEYKFGGYVRYWDPYAQAMVTLPLASVPLTVNPGPNLMLHYFMERNILSDDALTKDVIEPTIPAELAVMVENQGYGPAVNMMISSAQPKIIENEKGLAINFLIVGSNFQGKPKELGATNINFGTVPALQTRIGQWYFTSSLLGKFVSYEANVVHANSFGNPDLSLVKGVRLHELTKSIRLYGDLDDGINDFLVNDYFDAHDVPDTIYFSQGNRTEKVYTAKEGNFSAPVAAPSFTNTLMVAASNSGWNYIKLDDPGNKLYDLVSVTRSDGQVIPLDNAWLTFVTLPVSRPPVYENKFHFIDEFPSLEPVTYTVVWKPRNLDVPEIVSIEGITEPVTALQVQNLTVKFNKTIDPATFTFDDLNLTFQGGPNIMNKEVVITQTDATTFNVDVSALTTGNGFYNLTVQAASVQDIYGTSGLLGKQVTWTQFLTVPAVQAFYGIPEGNMASSFDTIQVLFNLPIDEVTATPERFYILKDSLLQSGTLTIDSVRADKKLFYLSGLDDILTTDGIYTLVVDLPNIQSVDQVPGMKAQSVRLIVDNSGPQLLSLEKSTTGGLDPQHVTFVNIRFNEDVKGFNTASVKLTRDGELQLLHIAQLSNTDLKNWTAGNFGLLTYPEGEYAFTVSPAGFTDAMGNSGVGTQSISWTVNRSAVVTVSDLTIRPDLGFSDSDGVTSGESVEVSFNLSHDASEVTISQVDLSGEVVLTSVSNVAAGAVSVPVTLLAAGNTGIKVRVTGANGGVGTAEKRFFVDQVQLAAEWLFEPNQILKTQVESMTVSFNSKILSNKGFRNAIQFKRDGVPVSTEGLSFEALDETSYSIQGLRGGSSIPGDYQLVIDLGFFSKYSSGLVGTGTASVSWTVQSTNQAPVAKAGKDQTITSAGIVVLDGSLSDDPDADQITYHWVAPEGIMLKDSLAANPSFAVTSSDQGKTYEFLLIVRDGALFSTDAVRVTVDLLDLGTDVPQSITFKAIPTKVYGDAPFELEATATSGLPVSFRIVSGSARISGNILTIRRPGNIVVEASQKGNTTYQPATPVVQRFNVSRTPQRISFAAIPDQVYGAPPLELEATSTSGLKVKLSVLQGPAKISGGTLTITGLGKVRVQASQWGNGSYAPAVPVTHTFTVSAAEEQSISFAAIPDKVFGAEPFVLEATATSGLPVSFRMISGSASISGNILTIRRPGDIVVEASQKGNTTYQPATPVVQRFNVSRAPQRISFAAIPDQVYGAPPLELEATSTSGLKVKLSVLQGPAKISGGTLTITGLGQVRVQASQWGNGNYAPASPVTHTFNVAGTVADVASSTTLLQVGAETGMIAYPNPFSSKTKVSFVLPEGGAYILSLFDSKGALVKTVHQGRANAGERIEVEVSAEGLVNGTYLLRLSSQESTQTLRLLHTK